METVKIELPDGNTAELYSHMKHKTQRAVEELMREHLTFPDSARKIRVKQDSEGKITSDAKDEVEVSIDLTAIDFGRVNECIILNQVASWSFGPVSITVLDEQSGEVVAALKAACESQYEDKSPLPPSGVGN